MQAVKDFFARVFATVAPHSQNFGLAIRIVLIVMSLLAGIMVLRKIRKKKLSIDDSLFWIILSICLLILSIFPQIAFFFAAVLGIHDPTNFVFIVIFLVVLGKLFSLAIEMSIQKQRLNMLVQKLALANEEIEANKKKIEQNEKERV